MIMLRTRGIKIMTLHIPKCTVLGVNFKIEMRPNQVTGITSSGPFLYFVYIIFLDLLLFQKHMSSAIIFILSP